MGTKHIEQVEIVDYIGNPGENFERVQAKDVSTQELSDAFSAAGYPIDPQSTVNYGHGTMYWERESEVMRPKGYTILGTKNQLDYTVTISNVEPERKLSHRGLGPIEGDYGVLAEITITGPREGAYEALDTLKDIVTKLYRKE